MAARFSLPLYSSAPPVDQPPLEIQMVVREGPSDRGQGAGDALPDNLAAAIRYTGYGNWLSLDAGPWGHGHVDLAAGQAVLILSPRLAQQPELVSRAFLNTIFNNLLTGKGYAMLHCSGLLKERRVLLLMAPHNVGKSTTALHLLMAGYRLLSDSQIYLSPYTSQLQLSAFPVGVLKLREDVARQFPELQAYMRPEPVRDEMKYVLDLRQWNERCVQEAAVLAEAIDLCLMTRSEQKDSHLRPATLEEMWEAVMANSLHYDTFAAWQRNLAQVERLVNYGRLYHLSVGTDVAGMLAAVEDV